MATTLHHVVLQSVCAISRWCVVHFSEVWMFSMFHSAEFLHLSWSLRQSHPFTWPLTPLPHHSSSRLIGDKALQGDGTLERSEFGRFLFVLSFLAGPRLPSHVLQRLLGLLRVHVVLPRPRAQVQGCGPLRAALLVAREETKPAGTNRRQAPVSPARDHTWPVALECYSVTVQEHQ